MYNKKIILTGLLIFFLLELFSGVSHLETASLALSLFNIINYFYTLGKKINLSELVLAIVSSQILLAPVITYILHPESMPVDVNTYLMYTLPATVAFNTGYSFSFFKLNSHKEYIIKVKEDLVNKKMLVKYLFVIGCFGVFTGYVAPISVKNIANLFGTCLYISILYGFYTNTKYKQLLFFSTLFIMLTQTIQQGMFGHLIIWSMLWISFIALEYKWVNTIRFKLTLVTVGIMFLIVMQAVKFQYRAATWGDKLNERKGDSQLMQTLFVDNIKGFEKLLDADILFGAFSRLNQGVLIGTTMVHVPRHEPYADGEILFHFLYPFIPRIIWDDKPITGGHANMLRFANIDNPETHSSNISPFGEAYANFGPTGGILFMLFYASLFNFFFQYILKLSIKYRTLILWIPSLFIATLSIETDLLSIWGTFVTGSIFLIIFMQILRRFNIQL